jgi:hypothetical protein
MKYFLFKLIIGFLIIPLFFVRMANAQSGFRHLYLISEFAIQQNDTRQFGHPDWLFKEPKHLYGTWQFSLGAGINVWNNPRTRLELGILYSREVNNFFRPYDACGVAYKKLGIKEFKPLCPADMNYVNRYTYDLLILNLNFQGNILKVEDKFRLYLQFIARSSYAFRKLYGDTWAVGAGKPGIYFWTFDFFSVELNPGFGFEIGHFDLSFFYRWKQKRKDDMFFYDKLSWAHKPTEVSSYNPFKLGVILKWRLDFKKKDKDKEG